MRQAKLSPVIRNAILAALALAVLAAVALMLAAERPAQPARPAPLVTPVVTAPVRRGSIERTVTVAGVIRAGTETQLAARAPARVLSVPMHEGDRVRRGELLVQLDDRDARSALESTAAGVRSAEAVLAKAETGATIRGSEVDTNVASAA